MMSEELKTRILQFRAVRDWEQFHSSRSLASAIVIEAAELLEPFRWARDTEINDVAEAKLNELGEEVADLLILLTYFTHDLGIDVKDAVERKLAKNELKYPVDKFRGSSRKYSEEGPIS